jgi:hypothetical protein
MQSNDMYKPHRGLQCQIHKKNKKYECIIDSSLMQNGLKCLQISIRHCSKPI